MTEFDIKDLEEKCFGGEGSGGRWVKRGFTTYYMDNMDEEASAYMLVYERDYKTNIKLEISSNE